MNTNSIGQPSKAFFRLICTRWEHSRIEIKTGYQNLDDVRIELATSTGPRTPIEDEKSYRLPYEARVQRISTLLDGLAHLEGGAKQSLHYTDVSPALTILAVTKGGNHIFGHVIGTKSAGGTGTED